MRRPGSQRLGGTQKERRVRMRLIHTPCGLPTSGAMGLGTMYCICFSVRAVGNDIDKRA